MAAPMRTLRRDKAHFWSAFLSASLLVVAGCASSPSAEPSTAAELSAQNAGSTRAPVRGGAPELQAIVDAPDRTPEDREADVRRHPLQLLEFIGVSRGQRVADLGAGSGYTTELLARAVGPSGVVYAQNNRTALDKYVSESWPKRLEREATRNVVRMDREFDSPFAPEAQGLQLVTLLFSYHDVIAANEDRTKLNRAVFDALEPGGLFVIADHQAAPGTGVEAASSLHRIDQKIVRTEVEAVGFVFVESGDFLGDPSDDGKEPSFARGFKTDRFVLKFKKPEAS
jgi:predicted methyltransferase